MSIRNRDESRGLTRLVVVPCLIVLGVTAFGPSTSAQPIPNSLIMVGGAVISGREVDPASSSGATFTYVFQFNVYDRLFKFDKSGNPRPSLATGDVVSSDGLTHTISIRDNVLFHDGSRMTAEDVKFSLDRARGADDALPNPTARSFLAAIARIDVSGPRTVVLHLSVPDPILQNELAFRSGMIVPKEYLTRVGNEGFWKKPIGSGPYQVEDVVPGQYVKLQAFSKYWGNPKPSIKNVTFKFAPDQASRTAQLQAGDADFVIDADPSQVDPLRKAGFTVVTNPTGENFFVKFNHKKGNLSDHRIGRALNLAVDRGSIIKHIYLGYATPTASLDSSAATRDPNLKPYPYDPVEAKRLLANAGFDFNTTLDVAVPVGLFLKLESDVAPTILSDLQKIGVKVKLINMDIPTWVKDLRDKTLGAMTFSSATNLFYDTIPTQAVNISCGGTFSLWCDPALDKRYKDLATMSGNPRLQAIRRLDRYLHDHPPGIFLLEFHQINAMKADLRWNALPGTNVILLTDLSYKR